jgi:hypothetical protein
MGTEEQDGGTPVDWAGFELDLTVYAAERHIATLVAGGARVAESLGVPFSPSSFVLGALFKELGDIDAPDFQARVEAVQRLARHAGTVSF